MLASIVQQLTLYTAYYPAVCCQRSVPQWVARELHRGKQDVTVGRTGSMRRKGRRNNPIVATLLGVITKNSSPDTRMQVGDRGFHMPLSPWQKSLDPHFRLSLSPWQKSLDPRFWRTDRNARR